jgi:hypothetical protein
MFKKLETQVKKVLIEKEVSFKTAKEKKDFENELIFGDLLETLNSFKIEEAYESLSEEDTPMEGSADGTPSTENVVNAQEQLKNAQIKKKMTDLKAKTEKQIDSLQNQMK